MDHLMVHLFFYHKGHKVYHEVPQRKNLPKNSEGSFAREERLELPTPGFGDQCSAN